MDCAIVPLTDELIAGFHAVLDEVAREKRYLSFLEAPPLEKTTAWVKAECRLGPRLAVAPERRNRQTRASGQTSHRGLGRHTSRPRSISA